MSTQHLSVHHRLPPPTNPPPATTSTAPPFVSRPSSAPSSLTMRTATAAITAQTSEVRLSPLPHPEPHLTPIPAFLSYLRLSIYMAIVSVAIILSFHLRKSASEIELRMARPLGAIFWILSVACLGVGMANYISVLLSPPPPFTGSPPADATKTRSTSTAVAWRWSRRGGRLKV